jgi:hypothetical protein
VVHIPARVAQQAGHCAITPVSVSQCDEVVGQAIFISPALRHFAVRGPVPPERATGPAFRFTKLPPHMVNARPHKPLVLLLKLFQPGKMRPLHPTIKHPTPIEGLLRHADLAHRLRVRSPFSLQHFNLPKPRCDLFGLLTFYCRR